MVDVPTGTWVDAQVDAVELRKALGASLITPAGPTAPRPGRLPGPGNPLTVSPTAPASMAVLVKAGKAHTYRSAAYGPILGVGPDGDVTVPITAPATGSQWYRVYLAQRDTSAPANDADSKAVVDAIAGTAAATPTKPNLPAGALLLGEVLIPAGSTSVTAGMVTDLPTWTTPRGGVLPVADQAERVALQTAGIVWPGLQVLELATGRRLWHDGTRFRYEGDGVVVADNTARDALTGYAGLAALVTANNTTYVHNGTAWRPPYATAALLQSVGQNLAAGYTDVWLNAESIDSHGGHVTTPALTDVAVKNYTVQPGQAGTYLVEGCVVAQGNPAGLFLARLNRNGQPFPGCNGNAVNGAIFGVAATTGVHVLELAAGETVSLQAYSDTAFTTLVEANGRCCWLNVTRIA